MPLLIILLLIWTYTLTLGLHLDMDPVADLGVDFRHVLYHQRLRHCDCYVQTRKRRFQSGQINITFGPRDGDDCVESYDYGAREDERDCSTVGRSGYPAFDVLILTCCNIFMDIHLTHHITPPTHYNPRSPNQYPLNTPYQHTLLTHLLNTLFHPPISTGIHQLIGTYDPLHAGAHYALLCSEVYLGGGTAQMHHHRLAIDAAHLLLQAASSVPKLSLLCRYPLPPPKRHTHIHTPPPPPRLDTLHTLNTSYSPCLTSPSPPPPQNHHCLRRLQSTHRKSSHLFLIRRSNSQIRFL